MKNYLTDEKTLALVSELTGCTPQELSSYVGTFASNHWRFAGLLKGEATITETQVVLRHHFTKKIIVTSDL